MRIVLCLLALVVSIGGCASLGSAHANCVDNNKNFSDVTQCINTTMGATTDQRTKMYVLKANQLNESVQKGAMTELDARVALQETMLAIYRDATAAYGALKATR